MLAYLSWHRAAAGIEPTAYEQALERFHRSLAHQPPSGFRGSSAFRLSNLPWLAPVAGCADAPGYEDWYLLDDWTAVGVLEEAAVAHGHRTAHDTIAGRAGCATGSVYRLVEGHARPARPAGGSSPDAGESDPAVWVKRTPGHEHPSLCALLGDGMDRERDGLWRRCIGLGPAPEYCLLAAESAVGVAPSRLPAGWVAQTIERAVVWHG
ncbi:MAG TPA: hypothetical protein VN817_10965 [Solirubrobacteraceae bacterium]|nr:hypothetical protein [Solirubrobacteraceae bacterium]